MRTLYTILFYLLLPFILLRLLWRGFRAPAYWQRWSERFGYFPPLPATPTIWIHAVSVGEVQASLTLIQELQKRYPRHPLLITTMTPTGSKRVQDLFGNSVSHFYLPYDLPGAVTRFLNQVQPQLAILMETELWPNLLFACQRRKIPVLLLNARLSVPSAAGYRKISGFMRQMLNCLTVIAAQTEADANRFLSLGATADQVQITGNLKFDSRLPANLSEQVESLRQQWGTDRLIWIAASTHEGEEEQILAAFLQVKRHFKHLLLVLVPRHPERFNRVTTLCKQRGFVTVRRSEGRMCTSQTDIYIGDTMGELPYIYAACDVAFVGGSLVPIGGHNLMEPAAVGLPILVGPYTFECAHISRRLWEEGVAYQVNNFVELATALKMLLGDKTQRREMGAKGRQFVQQNRGALGRVLTILNTYLGDSSPVTVVAIPTLTSPVISSGTQ